MDLVAKHICCKSVGTWMEFYGEHSGKHPDSNYYTVTSIQTREVYVACCNVYVVSDASKSFAYPIMIYIHLENIQVNNKIIVFLWCVEVH